MEDFWSTGIYVLITVGALFVAMLVILLLTATAKPKKSRKRVKGKATGKKLLAPADLMLLAEGSAGEDGKGKKKKKDKQSKKEKDSKKSRQEKQEEERAKKDAKQSDQKDGKEVSEGPAGEAAAAPAEENVTVAELPSVDTLDDSEDLLGDEAAKEDLMSIFQVEEVEDSYVSDLANKLFDVETSNIQALGLEVLSVFSRGKPADESKEE